MHTGYDFNPIYFIQLDKIDANNKENGSIPPNVARREQQKMMKKNKNKKKCALCVILFYFFCLVCCTVGNSGWLSHRAPFIDCCNYL